MKSLIRRFLFLLLFTTITSLNGFGLTQEINEFVPSSQRPHVDDLITSPPMITVLVSPNKDETSPAEGWYQKQMKQKEPLREAPGKLLPPTEGGDFTPVAPPEKWIAPPTLTKGLIFSPLPKQSPIQDPNIYKDPQGRFKILYDETNPLLGILEIKNRFEKALEAHQNGFMGKIDLEEPIIVMVEELRKENVPKHEVHGNVIGVTSAEHAHYLMRINPNQATVRLFRHELVHVHMFIEEYQYVPFWLSEGYAHLSEVGHTKINNWMWQYLIQLNVCASSDLFEYSPNGDNIRHRSTGWVMAFYYENALCEHWKDVAQRKSHVEPLVAWEWVQKYAKAEKLNRSFVKLKERSKPIPLEMIAAANDLRSQGFEVTEANWDFSPLKNHSTEDSPSSTAEAEESFPESSKDE